MCFHTIVQYYGVGVSGLVNLRCSLRLSSSIAYCHHVYRIGVCLATMRSLRIRFKPCPVGHSAIHVRMGTIERVRIFPNCGSNGGYCLQSRSERTRVMVPDIGFCSLPLHARSNPIRRGPSTIFLGPIHPPIYRIPLCTHRVRQARPTRYRQAFQTSCHTAR